MCAYYLKERLDVTVSGLYFISGLKLTHCRNLQQKFPKLRLAVMLVGAFYFELWRVVKSCLSKLVQLILQSVSLDLRKDEART